MVRKLWMNAIPESDIDKSLRNWCCTVKKIMNVGEAICQVDTLPHKGKGKGEKIWISNFYFIRCDSQSIKLDALKAKGCAKLVIFLNGYPIYEMMTLTKGMPFMKCFKRIICKIWEKLQFEPELPPLLICFLQTLKPLILETLNFQFSITLDSSINFCH